MKKIGLIGGIGPVSTVNYYLELNRLYHNDFGVNEYPEIVIDSLSLNKVTTALADERYDIVGKYLKRVRTYCGMRGRNVLQFVQIRRILFLIK